MNRDELSQYLGVTAYSLGQVEKDYMQHIILGAISRKWSSYLVFKGGTALQKMGLIRRFSEDLDFTRERTVYPGGIADSVVKALGSYNYPAEVDRIVDVPTTTGFRIKVEGPLYRGKVGVCSVRLEISRREEVLKPPREREMDPPYGDILPYVIKVMDTEEIAAEKVRAILTRDKARDVYDLYRLIEHGSLPDRELIDKKLEYYDMELNLAELINRCRQLLNRWDRDLASLMEKVPPKDKALETIIKAAKQVR